MIPRAPRADAREGRRVPQAGHDLPQLAQGLVDAGDAREAPLPLFFALVLVRDTFVLVRAPRGLHEDAVGEVQVGDGREHREQALGDRAALLVSA